MTETAQRILAYVGLLGLLGVSLLATQLALGPGRIALHVLIAAAQSFLVAAVFMQLRESSPLVRVFAYASLLWLLILFGFMALDYVHR